MLDQHPSRAAARVPLPPPVGMAELPVRRCREPTCCRPFRCRVDHQEFCAPCCKARWHGRRRRREEQAYAALIEFAGRRSRGRALTDLSRIVRQWTDEDASLAAAASARWEA